MTLDIRDAATPWASGWWADAWAYWRDAAQRQVLFWDTLRQRGDLYLEHRDQGKPPVLDFDYDVIMDGRDLDGGVGD